MHTPALIDQWQRDRIAGLRRHARRRSHEPEAAEQEPSEVRAHGPGGDVVLTVEGVIRLDEEEAAVRR